MYWRGMERGSPTSRQKVLAVDSVNACLSRPVRSSAILHTCMCMTVPGVIRGCSVKWDFCEQSSAVLSGIHLVTTL